MKNLILLKAVLAFLLAWQLAQAQTTNSNSARNVIVDPNGVMRWENTNAEIKGFGVNYTVPFAHAFRSARKLGIDPLKAIDHDVYHFSRLGFDLFRVHVWDTEISDTLGNLLYNEKLHAFDYLLKKLSERNINYVITPIAFWGGGWPEPDLPTPGFSAKYGKDNCLTNPEAIKAQENYLSQFMNHINPYTGIAYKDDPHLIAMEISNEPHHREAPEKVTAFIQRMVESVRKTGYQKPIFYNISHSVHLADNYFKADIQGGTFQWYPTGLGYQQELQGNFLPNVDHYNIPFDDIIKKHKGAKLVYEFDAADVGRSYIYPAMARSFRKAGIQIATHFSYDPTFLAYANTEYNTHHMNLAFTPQKALSLMICSEVFHRIPMYKDYGAYPKNTTFDGFRVDYDEDLALLNIDEKFIYTNTTSDKPINESKLIQIAGSGTSPLIDYEGTGAYFLDKLEHGVWRLEVMPDALIVSNPYGRNSLDKTVAVIQWNHRKMQISLNDLGDDFKIMPLNEGNDTQPKVSKGKFELTPGVYLLTGNGKKPKWKAGDTWETIRLSEFHAPESSANQTWLVHRNTETAVEGQLFKIEVQAISPDLITGIRTFVSNGPGGNWIDLEKTKAFTWQATVPGNEVNKGFLTYYIVIKNEAGAITYPAGNAGLPFQWDFYDREPFRVCVLGNDQPVYLFNAQEDWTGLSLRWWSSESKLVPTGQINEAEYQVNLKSLFRKDNEDLNAIPIHDYTIRYYVNDKIDHLRNQLGGKTKLVIKGRSLENASKPVQIALVTKEGISYGAILKLGTALQEYEIPFTDLKKVKTVIMPRPYPTFLPYYFDSKNDPGFKVEDIEGIQISIGPGLPEGSFDKPHRMGIVSVMIK